MASNPLFSSIARAILKEGIVLPIYFIATSVATAASDRIFFFVQVMSLILAYSDSISRKY